MMSNHSAFVLLSLLSSAMAFSPACSCLPSSLGLRAPQQRGLGIVTMQQQREEISTAARTFSLAPLAPVLVALLVPAVAGAEPPEWLEDTRSSLDIGLAIFSLLFFLRIPLTWYPQMDLKKLPQAIVAV